MPIIHYGRKLTVYSIRVAFIAVLIINEILRAQALYYVALMLSACYMQKISLFAQTL